MNTLTSLCRLSHSCHTHKYRLIQPFIGKTLIRSPKNDQNQSLPLGPPFSDNLTSPPSDHPSKYISNYGSLENMKGSPSLFETNVEHKWRPLGSLGTKFDVRKVMGSLSISYAANFRGFIHSTSQKYINNEPPLGPMNSENEQPSRPTYSDNEHPSRSMNFDNGRPLRPVNFENERPSGSMNLDNDRASRPSYSDNERPLRSMNFSYERHSGPMNFENERPLRPMNFNYGRPSGPRNFENERPSRPAYLDNERPSRPTYLDNEQSSRSMNFVRGIIENDRPDLFGYNQHHIPQEVNADIVHIKILKNNTFITVTDSKGNKKTGASSGCLSGGGKVSRYAAEATAEHIGRAARNMGLKSVVMKVNGFTFFKKKRQAVMSFREGYTHSRGDQNPIVYIEDTTRRPHNGCRLPKKRRV